MEIFETRDTRRVQVWSRCEGEPESFDWMRAANPLSSISQSSLRMVLREIIEVGSKVQRLLGRRDSEGLMEKRNLNLDRNGMEWVRDLFE